ncbi:MAG: hypothetical protein ABI406_12835, partial [Ktedonobacteraceae bacterium]
MAAISGIRGMLLEEAILYLLRVSGYRTLEIYPHTQTPSDPCVNDPTITGDSYSGLKVLGRGAKHQIDAIADFIVTPPFTYPQRLLVEAKCYADNSHIGIEIIRNAVGVVKDVGEYWVTRNSLPPKARYHYQYALFSASNFSIDAQKYAFAHDIYLLPLTKTEFIQPLVGAIRNITSQSFGMSPNQTIDIGMIDLRRAIRASIRNEDSDLRKLLNDYESAISSFDIFIRECQHVNQAMIAMLNGRFPIFLVPTPGRNIGELHDEYTVQIRWDENNWYIRSDREVLFSFDLPTELFENYADQGFLSPIRALDLKEEALSEIQGIITVGNSVRIIHLKLDSEWLSRMRQRINQIQTTKGSNS